MKPEQAFRKLRKHEESLSEEEVFDLQCIVAESARFSQRYACNIIEQKFPLGEAAISFDDFYSFFYDKNDSD